MRILFDHQIFSLHQYGGIARYFYELANHIADTPEHEVEIFSPFYVNEYLSAPNKVQPCGIKIPRLFGNGRYLAWGASTALAYSILRTRRNIDIFHETYYSRLNCCPSSAKKIITVYDMIHEKFPEAAPWSVKTREAKAHAVMRADHVICISENTRRDLVELLHVPEEKTSVVYLGYSLTSKGIKKPSAKDRPYILYVGQRDGHKNFLSLLQAYADSALLRDRFSLVCFGGEQFSAYERELIKAHGLMLDSVIHFSGGDDVLAGLYGAAAAFVYPSLYEGFGIPPLEAMSFGCPVVCSSSSSLPEVVGDAAELFDPADVTEMRTSIELVVSSSERAQLLIERGYERIKRFSWQNCARDTLDVYNKSLRG